MEDKIREIAYQKWESAGCPLTTEKERNRFWFEAEQEILKNGKCEPLLPCSKKKRSKTVNAKKDVNIE
jgi:hypothetical protein